MLVEPAAVLALITENERLLKLLERTECRRYVPLTELEGVPLGASRSACEVLAQRDQLRAEVAGLRPATTYERVNAELKAAGGGAAQVGPEQRNHLVRLR